MSPVRFPNLNVVWELPDNWCEWDHLEQVLLHTDRFLTGLGLADRFIFVVTSVGDTLPISHAERVVVLQTSDEGHEIPAYTGDAFMVFKNYRPFDPMPDNLRVIPLGCNKDVPVVAAKPMNDRSLDVFFIGRPEFREPFFTAMNAWLEDRNNLNAEIEQAPAFREGLAPEVYAVRLADTKIALSPRGVSHETFRTYEAMRAGCAVIAERQLLAWFTEGWPVIEVDDWNEAGPIVEGFLADPARLEELGQVCQAWWLERCSEEAVAHYIVRELSLRLMGKG